VTVEGWRGTNMEFIASCLITIGILLLVWWYFEMFAFSYFSLICGGGLTVFGLTLKIMFGNWYVNVFPLSRYLDGFEMQMLGAFVIATIIFVGAFIIFILIESLFCQFVNWVGIKLDEITKG